MPLTQEQLDERIRLAVEARRKLRKATLKFMEFGQKLLKERPPLP